MVKQLRTPCECIMKKIGCQRYSIVCPCPCVVCRCCPFSQLWDYTGASRCCSSWLHPGHPWAPQSSQEHLGGSLKSMRSVVQSPLLHNFCQNQNTVCFVLFQLCYISCLVLLPTFAMLLFCSCFISVFCIYFHYSKCDRLPTAKFATKASIPPNAFS